MQSALESAAAFAGSADGENQRSMKTSKRNMLRRLLDDMYLIELLESDSFKRSDARTQERCLEESLQRGHWKNIDQLKKSLVKLMKKGRKDIEKRVGELDTFVRHHAIEFEKEEKTKGFLRRARDKLAVWKKTSAAVMPRPTAVRGAATLHVNQLILALYHHPERLVHQDTAWPVLGGSWTTHLPSSSTNVITMRHAPLPRLRQARESAVHSIMSMLQYYGAALTAHCDVPPVDAPGCQTVLLPCTAVQSSLYVEERSEVNFVRLPRHQTYHVTKYRKHRVQLPFEAVVNVRRERYYGNLVSTKRESFGQTALSQVGSSYTAKVATTATQSSQCILTHEVEEADRYCVLAFCVTKDDAAASSSPPLREWASWYIVQRHPDDDDASIVVQLAVATGLQHHGHFLPFEGHVMAEWMDENESFACLEQQLAAHYADVFAKDARRTVDAIQMHVYEPTAMDGAVAMLDEGMQAELQDMMTAGSKLEDNQDNQEKEEDEEEDKTASAHVPEAVKCLTDQFTCGALPGLSETEMADVICYITEHPMQAPAVLAMQKNASLLQVYLRRLATRVTAARSL
ncbi:Aste57867_18863 [Aphanomyces stellatus]|uniref:Aste57867_18863 protein n=1 Tax=Aphanomyces stellatus TaxID=120398 RepID=A0A485LD51_9STRA|nr:hypothetical protein As57867_018799 [Aphanomyces stellatus]VFT95597.1 Aste57867_18863 [Aphanomyces stellatus]